jgi:predicted dehydrogenase
MRRLGFEIDRGILSSDPDKAMEYATDWGITGYRTLKELADSVGTSYVTIATPNAAHFEAALYLLGRKIPVLLEKPLTVTLTEAQTLAKVSFEKNVPFAVAYTYPGYWATTVMKRLIRSGRLGPVRSFALNYLQGWQAKQLGIEQEWRRSAGKSGAFNCTGDISTHLVELLCGATGLSLDSLCLATNSFPDEQTNDDGLDNDSNALIWLSQTKEGIKPVGTLKSTQIAVGHSNDIGVHIFCKEGSVYWNQLEPEKLRVSLLGQAPKIFERGEDLSGEAILDDGLLDSILLPELPPSGHISGMPQALATVHYRFGHVVNDWRERGGNGPSENCYDCTMGNFSGLRGMEFLDACQRSEIANNAKVEVNSTVL